MTIEIAMNNVSKSISNELNALARLLEAEGKKVQKFIDEGATSEELIKVNESVNATTSVIQEIEKILKEKLAIVTPFINN